MKRLLRRLRRRAGSADASPVDVFLTEEALALNDARLCHLASLGLDLAGKRVLEVGGGIGLLSCFFESLGCDLLLTEARPDNLAEAQRRYPHRRTMLLDLDSTADLAHLGRFDIVFCYGTLYHLSKPAEALEKLSAICDDMILLETCVSLGDDDQLHPEVEPAETANQATTGLGCRPTRRWVLSQLEASFGHAYQTVTQPRHPDFVRDWARPEPTRNHRAVFVGSRTALTVPTLSRELGRRQDTVPDGTDAVWIDVGAHLGETTFEQARENPTLKVYAFEPNLAVAAQRFNRLGNFTVLAMAVGECNGYAPFYLNAFSPSSSLLPLDEARRRQWIGGDVLREEGQVLVPTTRLDTFLESNGISRVDFLKVDAQGADLSVVRSAGSRLRDIERIKVEVTVTPTQINVGAASKAEMIQYMTAYGFALISERPQSFGQEENLVFFRLSAWSAPRDQEADDIPARPPHSAPA